MSRAPRRAAVALGLTLLLVASAVVVPVTGTTHDEDTETADEVYVAEDGDVVLVYEESRDPGASADGQVGVDVEENLVYGLLTDSVEEQPDVRWNLTALAEPSRFESAGNLTAPRPESLESVDFAFTGHSDADDSRADLDVSATLAGEGGATGFLQSAVTEGELTMGPDRLTLTGDLDAQSMALAGQSASESLTLAETGDGYALSVERNRTLSPRTVGDWQNRSAARKTIREQYGLAEANASGPTADVTLDTYSLTEAAAGTQRLDTSFTVQYRDVDEALRQQVVSSLAQPPGASEQGAEQVADELLAASLEEISYEYAIEDGEMTGNLNVAVSDYDDLVLAYLDYAQSLEDQAGVARNLERTRAQFEAQRAAGLEQHYDWDGELQSESDGTLGMSLALDYRTTNWGAYVEELQSRDLPTSESDFALNGTTTDDRLTMTGHLGVEGEQLFADVGDQFAGGMASGEAAPEWLVSLAQSRPQRGRLDASYDGDGLRVEGGAAFGNLSALRDQIAAEYDAPSATNVVGEFEGDTNRVYVTVEDALDGDVSESAARDLAYVAEDATVHSPGSWSEDDVPAMDVEQAEAFVQPGQSAGAFGPGFGAVAAVLALLGVALLARRRR